MAHGGLEKIADAAFAGCRGWPPSWGHLRTLFLRSHPDLGDDEFHQFCPWRIRHARYVRCFFGGGLAPRRSPGFWLCLGFCIVCPRRCDLRLAYPLCAAWADAVADLSTFGLALLLRYTAFFIFSANFVSLPETSLSGTLNVGGILMPVAQLVAGVVAIALTVGLHLLLTRTTVGSKLLAVSEDRNAAMLMGIRPDRMQALAWGLSAGAAGIAGALMATSYPWSPSVGETFGLTAFVVVALGGFGSVPGALYAGLIIGLIQAVSAFWFGPIYKDIVVYGLFVALLWLRPQGLMGKA